MLKKCNALHKVGEKFCLLSLKTTAMLRLLLVLTGFGLLLSCESPALVPRQPNVLLILADDQRAATLTNPAIHTPNLDRLRERGLHFTQAHIMGGDNGAVCAPSRNMLLTSRRLGRLPAKGFELNDETLTLGQHLQANGYHSWGTGKWHNTRRAFSRTFADGEAIFMGGMCDPWTAPLFHYQAEGDYPDRRPVIHDPHHTNQVDTLKGEYALSGRHATEIFADAAVDYLESRAGQKEPFFCYLAFTAPHDPRSVPPAYHARYDSMSVELPPNFMPEHPFDNGELIIRDEQLAATPRQPEEVQQHLRDYYAMITHLDAQIGRLLEVLEEAGQLDNTLIVFAGDNGLAVGQHGLMGKQNLYQHSIEVPLLISGPGVPEGQEREAFCYLTDLFPTLCELTGSPVPAGLDGRSLVPALQGEAGPRDSLFFQYKAMQGAIRTGDDKLIRYTVDGSERVQLFDLAADPWEQHDLSAEEPEKVAALTAAFVAWEEQYGLSARGE